MLFEDFKIPSHEWWFMCGYRIGVCVVICVCVAQRLTLGVLLVPHLIFLWHGFSLDPARLRWQQVLGTLLSLPSAPQHWGDRHALSQVAFTCGCLESNSGPHVCMASSYFNTSSSQSTTPVRLHCVSRWTRQDLCCLEKAKEKNSKWLFRLSADCVREAGVRDERFEAGEWRGRGRDWGRGSVKWKERLSPRGNGVPAREWWASGTETGACLFSGPQREQKASGERSGQQVREEDSTAQGLRGTSCSMGQGPSTPQIFYNGPLLVL